MDSKPARLSLLLERRSTAALTAPAPGQKELDLIFQAALSVPDFMHLRPFRFFVAEGAGLDRLGAMMEAAAIAAGKPSAVVSRCRTMPHRAPMVVVVAALARPSDTVTLFEQRLSAGCAVMAMQMAAQGLGFGGLWRSGWLLEDPTLHHALGLGEGDRLVGFLYLGTPKEPPAPRPFEDSGPFVTRL